LRNVLNIQLYYQINEQGEQDHYKPQIFPHIPAIFLRRFDPEEDGSKFHRNVVNFYHVLKTTLNVDRRGFLKTGNIFGMF